MSWLYKGEEEIDKVNEKYKPNSLKFEVPDRFWMPYESTKPLYFADDEGTGVLEHCPYYNRTRKDHWFTCRKGIDGPDAQCCRELGTSGSDRYMITFYTIVDMSEREDDRGNVYSNEIKLFGAKWKVYQKLQSKRRMEDGFAGHRVKASRYKDEFEPGTGSEHNILEEMDPAEVFRIAKYKGTLLSDLYDKAEADPDALNLLEKVFNIERAPDGSLLREMPVFNYYEVLKPPSKKELAEILAAIPSSAKNGPAADTSSTRSQPTHSGQTSQADFQPDEDAIPF